MNEFERKLSQQTFRIPPPDLREAIFAALSPAIVPGPWTWRDWFWPSPQAWAALAAVWLIFVAVSIDSAEVAAPKRPMAQRPAENITLLALHRSQNLDHVLELSN